MKEIAPNVYIETDCRLVTVGAVLTGEGWLCIDSPPYPNDAQEWLIKLREISDQPVKYVINTDAHRHRITSNAIFNAPVITHETAAAEMLDSGHTPISQTIEDLNLDESYHYLFSNLKIVPPEMSFGERLLMYCEGQEIELLSKASATPGTIWVVLKAQKVIFAGDSAVVKQHPYLAGDSSKNWLDVLRQMRQDKYKDWVIVSGRDGVIDPDETNALSEYLRLARRRVTSLCKNDRPRSETSQFIAELLLSYPYKPSNREMVQRRIKTGLDAIYDELKSLETCESEPE